MRQAVLELDDIQGDVLEGLQKNAEAFIFFKIIEPAAFKGLAKQHLVPRITSAKKTHERRLAVRRRKQQGTRHFESFEGLNPGLTKDGLTQLIGRDRPPLEPAFEQGADHPETIARLNDPPKSRWLPKFVSDRIDGVFLVTGPDRSFVVFHSNELLRFLADSIKIVYSEIGNTRPGAQPGFDVCVLPDLDRAAIRVYSAQLRKRP